VDCESPVATYAHCPKDYDSLSDGNNVTAMQHNTCATGTSFWRQSQCVASLCKQFVTIGAARN